MVQFARPTSDASNGWASGGWADIDEESADDGSTFTYSNDKPASELLEVHLEDPSDPVSDSGHTVRYRYAGTDGGVIAGGGNNADLQVSLLQGGSEIASGTFHTDSDGTWRDGSFTLSAGEADSITDYTDLRIRFVASGSGGSGANRRGIAITWAEFEVPDVAPPVGTGAITAPAATLSGTGNEDIEVANLTSVDNSLGGVWSTDTTYATAQSGGSLSTLGEADARSGQRLSGADYSVYEGLIEFDLGAITDIDTVALVDFAVRAPGFSDRGGVTFDIEVYSYDFGATIEAGDYVDPSTLSTLLGTFNADDWAVSAYNTFAENGANFRDAVKAAQGGALRLILVSDRSRLGTVPPASEYVTYNAFDPTNPPKLDFLYIPTATSASGTGAITAPAAQLSGTGRLEPDGTGAITAPAATLSGTGRLEPDGVGVITAPAAQLSGVGLETIDAPAGAITAPSAQLSGTGEHELLGTGAITAPAAQLSGVGLETIDAPAGAITAPAATLSGTGNHGAAAPIDGSGAITAPAATLSGSGLETIDAPAGAITAPAAKLSGTGTLQPSGTGIITAPAAQLSGNGLETIDAPGGAITSPAATLSGTGRLEPDGTGAITAPAATLSGTGLHTQSVGGSGAITAPAATLSGTGRLEPSGIGAITAPAATLSGTGTAGGESFPSLGRRPGRKSPPQPQTATGVGRITAPSATLSGRGGAFGDDFAEILLLIGDL